MLLWAEGSDLAKGVTLAPNPCAEAGQLYNLRMVDEQVDIHTKLTNVPMPR